MISVETDRFSKGFVFLPVYHMYMNSSFPVQKNHHLYDIKNSTEESAVFPVKLATGVTVWRSTVNIASILYTI